jgi:hypothetical protein
MTAAVRISSSHCRYLVIFVARHQGPGGARGLVGNGNGNEPGRFATQEGPHPGRVSLVSAGRVTEVAPTTSNRRR